MLALFIVLSHTIMNHYFLLYYSLEILYLFFKPCKDVSFLSFQDVSLHVLFFLITLGSSGFICRNLCKTDS